MSETLREKLAKAIDAGLADLRIGDFAAEQLLPIIRAHAAEVARTTDLGTKQGAALHAQCNIIEALEKMQ